MKTILRRIRCFATTESDGDEIYCEVVSADSQVLARITIGNFAAGADVHADKTLWEGNSSATIRFMESDENEPEHGSDDFIGEGLSARTAPANPAT